MQHPKFSVLDSQVSAHKYAKIYKFVFYNNLFYSEKCIYDVGKFYLETWNINNIL